MRPWRCSPHDKFGAHIRGLRDQSSLSLSVSLCLSLSLSLSVSLSLPYEDQQETICKPGRRPSPKTWSRWHRDLGLPAPSLWHFVRAARAQAFAGTYLCLPQVSLIHFANYGRCNGMKHSVWCLLRDAHFVLSSTSCVHDNH